MTGKSDEECSDEEDLDSVEAQIQFTRDDYRLLTNKIKHYTRERSRMETVLRKLKARAARIKDWQQDGEGWWWWCRDRKIVLKNVEIN